MAMLPVLQRLGDAYVFLVDSSESTYNKVGLKCPSVRPYVLAYVCNVRTYVRPSTKRFFDFNEICHVGRGRWVMHDGMQYDSIQGQGHEPLEVGNSSIFRGYLLLYGIWQLTTDS